MSATKDRIVFSKTLSLNFFRDRFKKSSDILHLSVVKLDNVATKALYDDIVSGDFEVLSCNLDIADFISLFSAVVDLQKAVPELLSHIKELHGTMFLTDNDRLIVVIKDGATKKITGYLVKGGV